MTGKKGKVSKLEYERNLNLIKKGIIPPRQYTDSIDEALKKAGL
jgi:hypothetical protein